MFQKRSCFVRYVTWIALILKTFAKVPTRGLNVVFGSETEGQQNQPCLLLQVECEEEIANHVYRDSIPSSWKCQAEGQDVVNAGASPSRQHVLLEIEGIDLVFASNTDIQSGVTTLLAIGGIVEDHKLKIFPENRLIFGTYNSRSNVFRKSRVKRQQINAYSGYAQSTGTKTVLAVRVKTKDAEPTARMPEISDNIFGTSGDIVNLRSQIAGCSHGKMRIEMARNSGTGCNNDPAYTYFRVFGDGNIGDCSYFEERDNSTDYCRLFGAEPDAVGSTADSACCICGGGTEQKFSSSEILNGVIEIALDLTVAEDDCFALEEEAINVLESKFDGIELYTMFDHVMLCLPPGTQRYGSTSWRAYAYINHYLQVYHDDWCNYPKTQVHEMSHNLGLAHAWISVDRGFEETVMGSGFRVDEGPIRARVCFNPSKSYQLGWYDDKNVEIYPASENWRGNIVGVGNYDPSRNNAVVVIKIAGLPGSEDYYIGFNHAIGYHIGTSFGVNKVKIVRQGTGFAQSWMEALLGAGESHVISDYLGGDDHLMIRVVEIDESDSAFLEIFTYRVDDICDDFDDFLLKANDMDVSCGYFAENAQVGCSIDGVQVGDCSGIPCMARDACCHCGGGSRVIHFPTSLPTTAPTPTTPTALVPQEKSRSKGHWFVVVMFCMIVICLLALLVKFAASVDLRRRIEPY